MWFRVTQIFEMYKASSNKPRGTGGNKSGIKIRLLESLILKWVIRLILIQWMFLVGEATIKVNGGNQDEGEVEAILADLEDLLGAPEIPLSESVKTITESSKKKIIFSPIAIS
jgi:hypothetical protein